jgi:hypothetical protein
MFSARGGFEYGVINTYPTNYWWSAIDLKQNATATTSGTIKILNNTPYVFGRSYSLGTTNYRPYVTQLNDATGNVTQYIVYPDQSNFGHPNQVEDVLVDNTGNTHVVFDNLLLARYTSSFSLLQVVTLTSGLGSPVNMVKDTSGYIYLLSVLGTSNDMYVTKLNPSTYAVIWSMVYSYVSQTVTESKLLIDQSNNIYIVGGASSSPYNILIQINTSGAINWQKTFAYFNVSIANYQSICIDNSNNIYILGENNGAPTYTLIQLSSTTGNKQYEYTISGILNPSYLTYNGTNIVVAYADVGGNFTITTIGNITGTPTSLASTTYFDSSYANVAAPSSISNDTTNIYVTIPVETNSNGSVRTDVSIYKLNSNGNLVGLNNSYSYTVTPDSGNLATFSGTITSSSNTLPTFSSNTNVTVANGAYSNTTFSASTANTTLTANTIVPFNYSMTI